MDEKYETYLFLGFPWLDVVFNGILYPMMHHFLGCFTLLRCPHKSMVIQWLALNLGVPANRYIYIHIYIYIEGLHAPFDVPRGCY